MRWMKTVVLGVLLSVAPLTANPSQQPRADAIQISELADNFELRVPVSRLILTIPKGNLSRKDFGAGGATASPRYFSFEDNTSGLIISGWFEPQTSYAGAREFWKRETMGWQQQPQNVSFSKAGDWDVIAYDIQMPIPGSNSHLRAELAKQGTWIDLHLSLTSPRSNAEARAKLLEVLGAIQVTEAADSDSPPQANAVSLVEAGNAYELSYPASKLMLVIPKLDLAPDQTTNGKADPQFFSLKGSEIRIYGYFRPAKAFPGIKKVWEEELEILKTAGLGKATKDIAFRKVGDWDAVLYNLGTPLPGVELPVTRAGLVQGETWIALTLRIYSKRPIEESKVQLLDLLKSIEVRSVK